MAKFCASTKIYIIAVLNALERLMSSNGPERSNLFINKVDQQTREQIIKLDQKLRMMRAEIETKLASIELYGASDDVNKQNLLDIQQEVNAAMNSISSLVNMVIEPAQEEVMLQEDSISRLRDMLSRNLENISKMGKV